MSNFTCLDQVPLGLLRYFYKLFCHDESKWLFSAEYLLSQDSCLEVNTLVCYNHVIKGAFRYKRFDILAKAVDKIEAYNQEHCWQYVHNVPESAFEDFFSLFNGGDLCEELNVLMETWIKLKFVTNAWQVSDLIGLVERNSREYSARVGKLVEKGFQMSEREVYKLPAKMFSEEELEGMAEQIKRQFILGNDDLAVSFE